MHCGNEEYRNSPNLKSDGDLHREPNTEYWKSCPSCFLDPTKSRSSEFLSGDGKPWNWLDSKSGDCLHQTLKAGTASTNWNINQDQTRKIPGWQNKITSISHHHPRHLSCIRSGNKSDQNWKSAGQQYWGWGRSLHAMRHVRKRTKITTKIPTMCYFCIAQCPYCLRSCHLA